MKSKFVFIVTIDVKNSGITVGKMFKTVSHYSWIRADIPGYYTNWTGGLAGPIKFVGPSFQMQIRN
jgi:hypothetical protein